MSIAIPKEYELPLYLFHKGELNRAYDLFGSHVVKKDGHEGVRFIVWAPKAKSVSVVGDFNHWDRTCNYMNRLGETGVWELFIAGLKKFDAYKYSIESSMGQIRLKADPYGYHMETRPNTAQKSLTSQVYLRGGATANG